MKKLKEILLGGLILLSGISSTAFSQNQNRGRLETLVSPEYTNITHSKINWTEIGQGLYFDKIEVYRGEELVDRVAVTKINPEYNEFKVFCGYDEQTGKLSSKTIEEWQEHTKASIIFNSAQYQAEPFGRPCALMICNGKYVGPKNNQSVRGMFLAEPKDNSLPKADITDSQFERIDSALYKKYAQGVQHWPILLNREGKIKVIKTNWQANRTVIAKDNEGNILAFTTEGGFFTLYNFAKFLKQLKESGLEIHTAMNLDGGYEGCMAINTPHLKYVTYGQFETYGPDKDATIPNAICPLPSVIGVFPRNKNQ